MTDADSHPVAGPNPSPGRPGRRSGADDKGLGTHLSELAALVVAYAKQETVDPIKSLGHYVMWGVAGAILLAAGWAMLALTAIRLVQAETGAHLHGNLTWVPYVAGILVAVAAGTWAVIRMVRGDRTIQAGHS